MQKLKIFSPKKIILSLFMLVLFASCSMMQWPDLSKIQIGMTKEQVVQRLGKRQTVISSKKYDDGILEIYEYETGYRDSARVQKTWLHFFNNELQEWGPKENYTPNNDDLYYDRYRRKR